MIFLDTNILLYSISTASEDAHKMQVARELLERPDAVLSVQVLQEFYVQSTRQSRSDRISHSTATSLLTAWLRYPIVPVDSELLFQGLTLRESHRWSYRDSAVVAAALTAECEELLTEDLNHGQKVGQLLIRNPFLTE